MKSAPKVNARSTCLHNKILDVDETREGYIAEGSGGVARKGTYVKNGVRVDGVIKLILKNKMSYDDINEVKVALEVQRVVPGYVIQIDILERCEVLDSEILPDKVNKENDLLLIGMERGIDSVAKLCNRAVKGKFPENELKELIKQSLKACYEYNCAGFFHRDIKPGNMVVVERQGKKQAVLIDFGYTTYMSNVENYTTHGFRQYTHNPPFDAMYLGLFFLNDVGGVSPQIKDYIIKKLQRYYEILNVLERDFVRINSRFFFHYGLEKPLETFLAVEEYPGNEIAAKYLKIHHNTVKGYLKKFNKSLIQGYTDDERGFKLLYRLTGGDEELLNRRMEEKHREEQRDDKERQHRKEQRDEEEMQYILQEEGKNDEEESLKGRYDSAKLYGGDDEEESEDDEEESEDENSFSNELKQYLHETEEIEKKMKAEVNKYKKFLIYNKLFVIKKKRQ